MEGCTRTRRRSTAQRSTSCCASASRPWSVLWRDLECHPALDHREAGHRVGEGLADGAPALALVEAACAGLALGDEQPQRGEAARPRVLDGRPVQLACEAGAAA